MMKFLILSIFIIALNFAYIEMMTDAQMKSTAKLMRNVCQPKNKVTNEQIDDMHRGVFDDSKEEKCYLLCCLLMMKAVKKDGKLDYDFAVKQVATLPARYREATYITLDTCKDSSTDPDPCASGYQLAKCMYFRDPEYYFLP